MQFFSVLCCVTPDDSCCGYFKLPVSFWTCCPRYHPQSRVSCLVHFHLAWAPDKTRFTWRRSAGAGVAGGLCCALLVLLRRWPSPTQVVASIHWLFGPCRCLRSEFKLDPQGPCRWLHSYRRRRPYSQFRKTVQILNHSLIIGDEPFGL